MPSHHEIQYSPYSPAQIYALVSDVERYPEFLPWCRASRILSREDNTFLAELILNFKGITERYTSRVTLRPGEAIEVELVEGPFTRLSNRWRFERMEHGGTRIDFSVEFQFKSTLLEKLIGALFGKAAEKMAGAFKKRADDLYGA